MARLHRGVEALAEDAQRQPARAGTSTAAGQPHGVETGRRAAVPPRRRSAASRKAVSKRALWATSTASPANARNASSAGPTGPRPRRSRDSMPVSRLIARGSGTPGVDETLEGARRAPAPRRGRRRSRRCGRASAASRWSRGRPRSRPRARSPRRASRPGRQRHVVGRAPRQPARRRAPPRPPAGGPPRPGPGRRASSGAASASGTGSCRSSSRWTRRSAPSSESWSPPMRTYVRTEGPRQQPDAAPVARAVRAGGPRRPALPEGSGTRDYVPLTASLRALPGLNFGTLPAGICTFSPERGFTPVRAARDATWNLPNPVNETSPPREGCC